MALFNDYCNSVLWCKSRGDAIRSSWFLVFTILGWVEFLMGIILLKIKGMAYSGYRWIMGIGYLMYFAIIAWTALDEISYIFILPLISIIILYKDPKLIKMMMWLTMFVLITSNLYKGRVKGMMEFVSSIDGALQFAIVLCCYACTNMAIKHLVESDGVLNDKTMSSMEMTSAIDAQVKNVADLMEDVVGLIGASVEHA